MTHCKIEYHSDTKAAYIRLNRKHFAKSDRIQGCIVIIDRNAHGEAIGIELIGVDLSNKQGKGL